jgi:hypothetical protein
MDPTLRDFETIPDDLALDHGVLGISLSFTALAVFGRQRTLQIEEVVLAPAPERHRPFVSEHDSSF